MVKKLEKDVKIENENDKCQTERLFFTLHYQETCRKPCHRCEEPRQSDPRLLQFEEEESNARARFLTETRTYDARLSRMAMTVGV